MPHNPNTLECRSCEVGIGLHHLTDCPYCFMGLHTPRLVESENCNYDDEYRLPDAFRYVNATHYCQIRRDYRQAKQLVRDIETLCRDNNIKIPSE